MCNSAAFVTVGCVWCAHSAYKCTTSGVAAQHGRAVVTHVCVGVCVRTQAPACMGVHNPLWNVGAFPFFFLHTTQAYTMGS